MFTFTLFLISTSIILSQAEMFLPNNNKTIHSNVSHNLDETLLSYRMAIIWPTGYCRYYRIGTPCRNDELPQTFTIHGLWAIDKSKPKPPPSTQAFDITLLEELEEIMYDIWPDIPSIHDTEERHNQSSRNFWAHEWQDHGQTDPLFKNTFFTYFLHAILLFETINLTNPIMQLGNPTTVEAMQQALTSVGKTRPYLLCSTDGNYLAEIHFCMDATAVTFVDCIPKEKLDKRDCREGVTFFY